ncbi:MAG: hypothetical protein UT63_C0002G0033 [Candidatus Gottesmanbacteria bacterium GW2011_GWC2_39_8]|uniref:NlpC/P60 domain-containing protein n=1 Tax=Candidatus Gottesmanbacteria bacterium GW2011_GWC2_39_8 TaxID=1618450 RepID=A0A0G0Q2M8_9BACT|nr:MAG: hypothetical protein UT63_C0002G0033 [Candidatus Gottesmanbacteria bacterium GW2011_GWC2_39_8]
MKAVLLNVIFGVGFGKLRGMKDKRLEQAVYKFIEPFLKMRVGNKTVRCPYWMNKLQDGKVKVRGRFNGKGTAQEIEKALNEAVGKYHSNLPLRKIAKKERIGIDCSGFVYQILEKIYQEKELGKKLDEVFSGGINRTNANTLTGSKFSQGVNKVSEINIGDLVRLMGGTHVLIVVKKTSKYITYAHSSDRRTKIKGVHLGKIVITDQNGDLSKQVWLEKSPEGDSFGKYFRPGKGDSIFRLKSF